jgi:hypothetical protein
VRKDVLKCLIWATLKGEKAWYTLDVFPDGHGNYAFVLEWSSVPGREGEFPTKALALPESYFQPVSDPSCGWQLKCRNYVNFDKIPLDATDGGSVEDVWSNPDNLFKPRPKLDNGDSSRN